MAGPVPHSWLDFLDVYEGGRSKAAPGVQTVVKLSSNETPFGPSPKALEAYAASAATIHRYPDATAADLKAAIADLTGLDPQRMVCGLGSDEVLKLVCRAYAGPGDEVIYSRYGFMMYPIAARSVGATPVEAPDNNFVADVDQILAAVTANTKVVFLANPNNPTGTYLPRAEVIRLVSGLPSSVVLVLDAAYAEYADAGDYTAGEDLVDQYPNIVVTRTFSKIYGLAALRLGWGYGSADVISMLDRLRDPFNLPTPTQKAGIAAVLDQAWVDDARSHNTKERARVTASLTALGLNVVPSQANFILIRFTRDGNRMAEAANDYLLKHGYILRWLPKQGLGDCLRLTIGLTEENDAVIALLRDFLAGDAI